MSFLHPALLLLLPLAAVPIILHLITRHRLKITDLSTFRFLIDGSLRQRSRLRFREALLTALRTLFLLLLALTICRPIVQHWSRWFGAAGREKIVLIDCSASMNARTGGVSALERAKAAVLAVAQRLGRDERLTLIRVTATPETIFSRFSADNETLRAKIAALEASPARANFFAALKRVYESGRRGDAPPTVSIVTDAQASNWLPAPQGFDQIVPAGARLLVVNVGSRAALPNRAVIGDPPPRQPATIGLPLVLKPRVANYGDEPAEVTVRAIVNDEEVARASLTLKPGEEQVKELTFVPKQAGWLRGRFEIGPDRFPDDDSFCFSLPVRPLVTVAVVNGSPSPDPYLNETLYLRTALASPVPDDTDQPGGLARTDRDLVRSLAIRDLTEPQVTPDSLQEASVVILANCGQLTAAQFGVLRNFVAAGGGLIIFPGDLVKPEIYNEQFFAVPGPQHEHLTGVRFGAAAGALDRPSAFEWLAAIDFPHPVLAVFDNPEAKYLATARFYRWLPLGAVPGRSPPAALLRFAAGGPALVENRFGDGLVLTAAFSAHVKWSNLPLKPEFVPLVLRMVNYVQRRAAVEAPAVAGAEGVAEIAVAKDWETATGTVTDEAGRATPLAFQWADERLVGTFERATKKGYYQVAVKGGSPSQPRTGTALFAVNVAPVESNFRLVEEGQLRQLLPQARVALVDASAEAQQTEAGLGDEREIWRAFIWLAFVIIGVEFTIATLGGGQRVAARPRVLVHWIEELVPAPWLARLAGHRWRVRTTGRTHSYLAADRAEEPTPGPSGGGESGSGIPLLGGARGGSGRRFMRKVSGS